MQERHYIKYFAPAWFAVIMGTGGLANLLYLWQGYFSLGRILGTAIAAFADIFYIFVLIPWTLRWIKYYEYARRDLQHPLTGNFYVTMAVGTAIVGTNINLIWSPYLGELLTYKMIFPLWIITFMGVTFFTFYATFRFMKVEKTPEPEMINFSWIMAPIANMAVSLIGNPVLSLTLKYQPEWSLAVFIINTALFGIGLFLFIFVSAIVIVRLALHALPSAGTTPSFGIFLSAVGLMISAILDGSKNAQTMGILASTELSNLFALMIWGFGIWVLGIIILISLYQVRKGGIPFSMGWWAYIFPLAAYALGSQKIMALFESTLTFGYTAILTVMLVLLWLYTFTQTMIGALNGKLFTGTPIPRLEVCGHSQFQSKES